MSLVTFVVSLSVFIVNIIYAIVAPDPLVSVLHVSLFPSEIALGRGMDACHTVFEVKQCFDVGWKISTLFSCLEMNSKHLVPFSKCSINSKTALERSTFSGKQGNWQEMLVPVL